MYYFIIFYDVTNPNEMTTKESFENKLKQLGIVFEDADHAHIMNAIFINKQLTQSDLRLLKDKYLCHYTKFRDLINEFMKTDLGDLIIVSNEDAIPYQ